MKENHPETGIDQNALSTIVLPDTQLNLVEQFAYALQNRDAIGLRQLIDEEHTHSKWGDREGFIKKFMDFCDRMEVKYSGIYVHTVPGFCGRSNCAKGKGLGVTVNTTSQNKSLWRFNLIVGETPNETLQLWLCKEFMVNNEEIPF
jgi:hypothetical protein